MELRDSLSQLRASGICCPGEFWSSVLVGTPPLDNQCPWSRSLRWAYFPICDKGHMYLLAQLWLLAIHVVTYPPLKARPMWWLSDSGRNRFWGQQLLNLLC